MHSNPPKGHQSSVVVAAVHIVVLAAHLVAGKFAVDRGVEGRVEVVVECSLEGGIAAGLVVDALVGSSFGSARMRFVLGEAILVDTCPGYSHLEAAVLAFERMDLVSLAVALDRKSHSVVLQKTDVPTGDGLIAVVAKLAPGTDQQNWFEGIELMAMMNCTRPIELGVAYPSMEM